MRYRKAVLCFLIALLTCGHLVAAGPGGYVTLINGSPYDWKLVYSHEYHMDWKPAPIIPAGTSKEQYFEYWYDWGNNGDCGAEATYELVGSPIPASFQLQARQSSGKRIQVQFQDALSSLNNPENSRVDLGYAHNGGVAFILSGDGTQPYISSNPPVAWMQATLSTIGSKTLREIAMPDSHDAGMSELTRLYGGVPHNTQTQSVNIHEQLKYGARWFDIRPVHRKGDWYTGHFSTVSVGTVGAMGRMIPDIIADINKFTSQNPGELIILDLSHEMDCASSWVDHLSPKLWQKLYETLGGIHDLWTMDPSDLPQDYSSVPVSTFIQPGSKSAVLVRIPDSAPLPVSTTAIPLAAFVQSSQLPFDGSYSDTSDPSKLTTDQISKLQLLRTASQYQMQRSTWTLTLKGLALINVADWWDSIIGKATYAHRMLYSKLWPAMSNNSYPNLIEVDDVHSSQITALCMAINDHFASVGRLAQGKRVKRLVTTDVVVSVTPTPTVVSETMTAALPTLTPKVLRIKGRGVEKNGWIDARG